MIALVLFVGLGVFLFGVWRFLFKPWKKVLAFAARSPITLIAGPNGAGKTWTAMMIQEERFKLGRQCISTSRITDPRAPLLPDGTRPDHSLYKPWVHIDDILDTSLDSVDIIADEAVLQGLDARQAMSMNKYYRQLLQQLRKQDLTFTATIPSVEFVDKTLRTVAQHYVEVRGYASKKVPGKLWTSKRLFLIKVYNAAEFSQWSDHQRDKCKPVMRGWIWRDGKVADRLYSTLEGVRPIAGLEELGRCARCDGKPREKACKCDDPLVRGSVEYRETRLLEQSLQASGTSEEHTAPQTLTVPSD